MANLDLAPLESLTERSPVQREGPSIMLEGAADRYGRPDLDRFDDYDTLQGVGGSSPSRPTHNRRSEACSVVVFSTSALWEQRWEQPARSS